MVVLLSLVTEARIIHGAYNYLFAVTRDFLPSRVAEPSRVRRKSKPKTKQYRLTKVALALRPPCVVGSGSRRLRGRGEREPRV